MKCLQVKHYLQIYKYASKIIYSDKGDMQVFETIREKLGVTKYRLAQMLGINQGQYHYLDNKAQKTSIEMLLKLQKISKMEPGAFWKLVEKLEKGK